MFAHFLLDQELWYNVNVVGNVPNGKNIQSLAEAGTKDGVSCMLTWDGM
jgi:hypothetical protein